MAAEEDRRTNLTDEECTKMVFKCERFIYNSEGLLLGSGMACRASEFEGQRTPPGFGLVVFLVLHEHAHPYPHQDKFAVPMADPNETVTLMHTVGQVIAWPLSCVGSLVRRHE